ncbi:DMT family transporter [Salmonella enterica subsp. houtenae]|nr:DMT family transporter [Salmonella enterica subsp. houtenae]EIO1807444.1 DMT family transporter [Salmonella enterica]
MNSNKLHGIIFALIAAICNSSIGIFSVKLFQAGLTANEIAFYKCLVGFLIIGLTLAIARRWKTAFYFIKTRWRAGLVCAFFGFFIPYHFETEAYINDNVSSVVFVLFGSSTVFLFILSALVEKRFFSVQEIMATCLSLFGLYLIFSQGQGIRIGLSKGLFFACIAGIGYGTFLFLTKKLNFGAGLSRIFSLLFFGSLYLSLPFASTIHPVELGINDFLFIICLTVLPTIGGFWFTTKALTMVSSQSVQLVELSEPMFAVIFSRLFLGQYTTDLQYLGGCLIFFAILFYECPFTTRLSRKKSH